MGKTAKARVLQKPVAYFSAEFGFHESIPNYSGGLGILSGDHCKSASDLDLQFRRRPLLYRHGYFRQQIDKDGLPGSGQSQSELSSPSDPGGSAADDTRARSLTVRILGPRCLGQGLGAADRAHHTLPARYRYSGEQRGRPATSPPSFTAAISRCGSGRRSCSALAASTP